MVEHGTAAHPPKLPAVVDLFWCPHCGNSALGGPEEVFHTNRHCPGRRDPAVVMRAALVPTSVEPCADR